MAFLPVVPVAFDGTKRTGSPAVEYGRDQTALGARDEERVMRVGWRRLGLVRGPDRCDAVLQIEGNTLIANTLVRRYFLRRITGVLMAQFQMPRFRSDVIDDVFHSEVFAAEVLHGTGGQIL